MATYWRDFADGISGWVEVALASGQTAPVWSVVNTDQLQATSASGNNEGLFWTDIDADADRDDAEILCQIYADSTSASQRWFGIRVLDSGSTRTGYAVRVRTNSIDTYRFNGSTYTAITNGSFSVTSGTWCWVRFRVNGSTIRARVWADGDPEPGTWQCDGNDSTYTTLGMVGCIKGANTNTQLWRYFGVGTNGDTAPASAGSGGYTLTAAVGTYTLTGQAAGLNAARRLAAEQGTYTLTGQTAGLARGQRLVAEQGTYTLTGQAAGLNAARRLAAEQGTYTLTGVAAILATARVLSADQGAYTLTGQAAGLTYTPAGSYALTCDPGSYTLNGQAVQLLAARRLVAEQGTYTLTGQAAGLSKVSGFTLAADAGSYGLTGQAAGLARTRVLQCAAGAYSITGQAATLTYSGVQAPVLSVAPLGRVLAGIARPPALATTRRPAQISSRTR